MLTIDLANLIFLGCMIIGGSLLLLSVVLGGILDGILDSVGFDFDLGGVSFMPVLLGFVSMFGIGGLFGTEGLGLAAGPASLVGAVFGSLGAAATIAIFRFLRRAEAEGASSNASLVGQTARVSVSIPPSGYGSVIVNFDGSPAERRAAATEPIKAGSIVRISMVIGGDVVVTPFKHHSDSSASDGSQATLMEAAPIEAVSAEPTSMASSAKPDSSLADEELVALDSPTPEDTKGD